ncbi:MAG: phenylalanine--tRNA ligase subunit alpha [Bacteroidales bacterium]|nr:phenylalanine--tRNA ligase subunit alpha [Bacteroidales bacterium]
MIEKINQLKAEILALNPTTAEEVENIRINFLSKKGKLTEIFNDFRNVSSEDKKTIGKEINTIKSELQTKLENWKTDLQSTKSSSANDLDLTQQEIDMSFGSRHPVSLIKNELCEIFTRLGFTIEEGPEIEDDWHVFAALNFPDEHPARDMQDTFFIEKHPDVLLRTHTSSIQVRCMEKKQLPIRVICPGRVFRNEAISARAHCIFHQIEGLYIDKNVSFADLQQTLLHFARETFGNDTKIRLRPSYFPFTEPSAEMDISCKLCGGKGCNICKHTGWLEVLGCGMVDPNVLEINGIDSKVYSGYAFGLGLERIAMLKYSVSDLRLYFENDVRFLNQFKNY